MAVEPYYQYKKSAQERNIPFRLNRNQVESLVFKNCSYCNAKPYNTYWFELCNGIDRKDNSKGYFIENCVTCCKICNFCKMTMPLDLWLPIIKSMKENFNSIFYFQKQSNFYTVLIDDTGKRWAQYLAKEKEVFLFAQEFNITNLHAIKYSVECFI